MARKIFELLDSEIKALFDIAFPDEAKNQEFLIVRYSHVIECAYDWNTGMALHIHPKGCIHGYCSDNSEVYEPDCMEDLIIELKRLEISPYV